MKAHVSEDAVVDLAEGRGDAVARAHLDGCAPCREQVSEAAAMLAALRRAESPEPPAAYWPALTRAVSRRIDDEPRRGFAWRWLVPIAATAAIAAAAVVLPIRAPQTPLPPPAPSPAAVGPWSALPPLEQDEGLPVLEAAGDIAVVALDEGRGLDAFVAGLTDDEAQVLADELRDARQEGEL